MDDYGVYILDIDNSEKLKKCFISEIRDLMIKYEVYNFKGEFHNESEFNVSDFYLQGVGSSFYDLSYVEPKSK